MQDLRELQRTVADTQAVGRPPLVEASAGWIMRHRDTPDTPPAGDVHIFANSGRMWVRSTLGTVAVVDKTGSPVANPPDFQSGSASGSDAAVINQLRADAAGTKIALDNLLSSLRAAGIILT
ncbi:hypothetical protein JYK22_21360, partial [Nonomuraea sp. RK-328]|nr:hypothetical protein [Nonomuraea sp. RK-328]